MGGTSSPPAPRPVHATACPDRRETFGRQAGAMVPVDGSGAEASFLTYEG